MNATVITSLEVHVSILRSFFVTNSLGCILAELLTGIPLLPGEDEADQLACMIELLGMPPPKLIEASRRAKTFIR